MWRPAIEYPLAVTSFTRDQCLRLQKAYTGTFLSHMGIASTTSRALIFGSSHYSGFNLPELWVSQGTTHLTYLLGHLNAEDNVGVLLRITLDTLQLHLGFPLTLLLHNILNLLGLPPLGILWMKPLPSLPSLIPGSFPLRGRMIVTSCLD